jgi:hypothetical protein
LFLAAVARAAATPAGSSRNVIVCHHGQQGGRRVGCCILIDVVPPSSMLYTLNAPAADGEDIQSERLARRLSTKTSSAHVLTGWTAVQCSGTPGRMGIEAKSDLRRGVPASAGADDCPASYPSKCSSVSCERHPPRVWNPISSISTSILMTFASSMTRKHFQAVQQGQQQLATCSNADGGTAPL